MGVIDCINKKILGQYTVEISGFSDTFEDDPVEGQGSHVGSNVLGTLKRVATAEDLAAVVKRAILDYTTEVLGIDFDETELQATLSDVDDEDIIYMSISVNVDKDDNIPSDEQIAKWKRNHEELFVNDYDISITINKAEIPIAWIFQLIFDNDGNECGRTQRYLNQSTTS